MALSCDWDRLAYNGRSCSRAVFEVFVRLYEKGYIYKGSPHNQLVPRLQTALSDAEVDYKPIGFSPLAYKISCLKIPKNI